MARHGVMAKIAEEAAKRDMLRLAAKSVDPNLLATDRKLLLEAHEQGEQKKAAAGGAAKAAGDAGGAGSKPQQPANSLFYRLYPQDEKDDATQTARHYWANYGKEDDDGEEAPLASDEAMSGAFTALAFVNGQPTPSSSSAAAPGQATKAKDKKKSGAPVVDVEASSVDTPSLGALLRNAAGAAGSDEAEALERSLLEALGSEIPKTAPAPGALRPGCEVDIFGLVGAKDLNGKRGFLQFLDDASGRWQVEVQGAGPKRLKQENLRPVAQEETSGEGAGEAEKEMTFL